MKKGFDNLKYIELQTKKIKERLKLFDKLYLEIGGKLFSDNHASRVLPGFEKDAKVDILLKLKKDIEIIYCIKAEDIEKNKLRGEYGITYDNEILNLINKSTEMGFSVNSVVITLYEGQPIVDKFIKKLKRQNIKTYIHTPTKGYPLDVNAIVSEEGYGANSYIETTKKIILVNGPGSSSGKLATCLSQLYHEHIRGINAGYAKYETFPVWNLPLKHPINLAYEASTADIKDINIIDPYHLEKYGIQAINYNRDIETFPILKTILNKIWDKEIYFSPTDMGINTVASCIKNMDVVIEASKKEIVRRYYSEQANYKLGINDNEPVNKIKMLLNELEIDEYYLRVVKPALQKSEKEKRHVLSLELPNGKIITGKQTDLLSPSSSLIINAMKILTKIPDEINLLSPTVLEPILKLRREESQLSLQEVLIALSICSVTNPIIEKAMQNIVKLNNCDAHATYIIHNGDLKALKNLGINLTCQPEFYSNKVF
ncbi:MAG: DUF1846 family protein [Bacilli bacterium]|nr:DUF1846 family protein [Bacilli bacterium]MDD4408007.1 DUF1846 family protein [Bacilli bacterium]